MHAKSRRGTILVLTAVLMVALLAMVAFAIDIGYISWARSDLQHAADAGVLAGTALLPTGDREAVSTAEEYAAANTPYHMEKNAIEATPGNWNRDNHEFVPHGRPTDALMVTVDRADTPLFFGRMLGKSSVHVKADAVATFRPRDIMLVLDFSGSMHDENKLAELKSACRLFFREMHSVGGNDRVGFVSYETEAKLVSGLTRDFNELRSDVQSARAEGFTNIGGGMELARRELEDHGRESAMKMMVLMTDGIVNRPLDRDPRAYVIEEAQKLATNNFQLVAVSFGSDADVGMMQQVADIAAGSHFDVTGGWGDREEDLREVFRKIATQRPVVLVD